MKIQYKTIALDALFFCVGVGFRFIYIVRSSGCLGLGGKNTGISKEAEKHRSIEAEKRRRKKREQDKQKITKTSETEKQQLKT